MVQDALQGWMEPFQVVRDMLRVPARAETIGGAPQLLKVYQYMQAGALGVYWPTKAEGRPHLLGRSCLPYERTDRWTVDPDSLHSDLPNWESSAKDHQFEIS